MTPHDLIKTLAKFETSEDVAEFMRSHGVKGRPGSSCACALSRLFMKLTEYEDVSTSVKDVYLYGERRVGVMLNLDYASTSFVRDFDANKYPDLVEM